MLMLCMWVSKLSEHYDGMDVRGVLLLLLQQLRNQWAAPYSDSMSRALQSSTWLYHYFFSTGMLKNPQCMNTYTSITDCSIIYCLCRCNWQLQDCLVVNCLCQKCGIQNFPNCSSEPFVKETCFCLHESCGVQDLFKECQLLCLKLSCWSNRCCYSLQLFKAGRANCFYTFVHAAGVDSSVYVSK